VPSRFLVCVLAAVVVALSASPAAGAPSKPFTMNVAPANEWAGVTDNAYTVTLTNDTKTQELGSADVTVPAAITIVARNGISGPGNVLQLRNLALQPGASATITVGLRMPCVEGVYRWTVQAKQSNDFSGTPGNDLGPVSGTRNTTVDGSCALRFVDQPASAEKNAQIRADAFQPQSTHFVTVEAIDGSPAPQRLTWFTGAITLTSSPSALPSTSSPAIAGLATFSSLSIATSDNYTLHAATTADGVDPGDSGGFQVIGVVEECNPAHCSAQLAGAKSKATLAGTATSGSGFALLSLNLGLDPLTGTGCAGYEPPAAGEYYEFQVTGVTAATTVVVEYTKAAMKTFKGGQSGLEACLGVPGPDSFIAKDGALADSFDYDGDPDNGAEGFAGLLPDCPATPAKPCVLDRSGVAGGGASITIFVPADLGDPRVH